MKRSNPVPRRPWLKSLAAAAVVFVAAARGADASNSPDLSLSIRCTNDVIKVGDEIAIEFRITNRGQADYPYADRGYDRSGRMNEYALAAKTESGQPVPDPRANHQGFWMGGGLYQTATLKPGASFTKVIPLNRWALITEPGTYTVVGGYNEEGSTNGFKRPSAPITIKVLPRTEEEMDAYISDLTNRIAAIVPKSDSRNVWAPQGLNDLVMKLMYTGSPKIVPTLLDTMCRFPQGDFWEIEALLFYVPHTPEVRKAILATAMTRGFVPEMSSLFYQYDFTAEEMEPLIERLLTPDHPADWVYGAALAQKYQDDAFEPRVIAIATTTGTEARGNAIAALAYNRTDEGIKTLRKLLDDPDRATWAPLAVALLNADEPLSHRAKRPLKPGDFEAKDLEPLIRHLLIANTNQTDALWGAGLVEHFGGDTFTPQLVSLANAGQNVPARYTAIYALALNRTDEGVHALKELLHHNDPEIRQTTGKAIRYAYTERGNVRGKPLKPDDFDKKFQKSESPGK